MTKIDLNDELSNLPEDNNKANNNESSTSKKAFDLEHEKLLAELGFAANDAVNKDKDRKQKEIQNNLLSEKNKAMSIKIGIIAIILIILAVVLIFLMGVGKNKKSTPANAVNASEFSNSSNEFGSSFNQTGSGSYAGQITAPINQQGFESNPM